MSRVGKLPVKIPASVNYTLSENEVTIAGAKGTLKAQMLEGIDINQDGDLLILSRKNDEALYRARHGLMRALINNMVVGVSSGFTKNLEINGVGYRVNLAGSDLKLALGFSHEIVYKIPQGISLTVEQNNITISGVDKQQVGQVAADIRKLKKPEPYKGKGIKYQNERILRKSGKSGKDK